MRAWGAAAGPAQWRRPPRTGRGRRVPARAPRPCAEARRRKSGWCRWRWRPAAAPRAARPLANRPGRWFRASARANRRRRRRAGPRLRWPHRGWPWGSRVRGRAAVRGRRCRADGGRGRGPRPPRPCPRPRGARAPRWMTSGAPRASAHRQGSPRRGHQRGRSPRAERHHRCCRARSAHRRPPRPSSLRAGPRARCARIPPGSGRRTRGCSGRREPHPDRWRTGRRADRPGRRSWEGEPRAGEPAPDADRT